MALINRVAAACHRLASKGWRQLLAKHGLDITKSDLAAELARPLTIDRTAPGFQDFCPAGTRGIEPGSLAASLLYHAFASPDVHPEGQLAAAADVYPTLAELDAVENYVYGLRPFDLVRDREVVVVVVAYQYRPAASSAHGYHADVAFSRTGVARVGTAPAAWDGARRSFRADPPGTNGIAVSPARYAAFLAEVKRPVAADPIMGRRDQDDRLRYFCFPVHKLFDGRDCVAGANISVTFREFHRNDKLRRVHKAGGVKVARGFDVDKPPFVRDSSNGGDLVTLREVGASVLVVPRHHATLVRTVKQKNTVTGKAEIVRFRVPPSRTHKRFASSLLIEAAADARRAPEYVNIRHRVVPKGSGQTIEDLQDRAPADFDFDNVVLKLGGYDAAHFVDDSCDGALVAVVKGLASSTKTLAAYSLVTAPDFFPLSDQFEITNWVRHDYQTNQEQFAQGAPWPLCEGRRAANLELPRPDAPQRKAFDRKDLTMTAVVGPAPRSLLAHAPERIKRFASFLPDAASNVFAPGWDISLGTDGRDVYYAAYGLGSPFPEDAKLCAALNSYWPAVAPDASRTFRYQSSPTAQPLLDGELGYHPDHPKVQAGLASSRGWDGEFGPFLETVDGEVYVNFASLNRSDYVSNTLRNQITVRLTASIDSAEMISRMEALKGCIAALPPGSDRVNRTRLWLVGAERVEDWKDVATRAHSTMVGKGYAYLFVLVDGEDELPGKTVTRLRIRVKTTFDCQVSDRGVVWREGAGPWHGSS